MAVRVRRRIPVAAAAGLQVAALGLAAGAGAPAAGAAASAGSPGAPCPAAYPVDQISPGLAATGLTVSSGTQPSPFTATVLGVLHSGIAPGVDMVLVKTDSPAIRAAGGIWAGMSGSPVYAPDGRLIGAIAYALAGGASPIAGVTPAAAMQAAGGTSAALRARVVLPNRLQSRLVSAGAASATEAQGGMTRLATPLSVSGVPARRIDALTRRLRALTATPLVPYAGSASRGASTAPGTIVPGGNIAAALSYGDVTLAGIGTATTVCGSKVLAFGHPMMFLGKTALSAQSADAIYVQSDPTYGSFKVANLTGSIGSVNQDRLTAIGATLGSGPTVIPIQTTTHAAGGATRVGTTYVAGNLALPDIAAFHIQGNLDVTLQKEGEGSALLAWTITGRTAGGPFTLTRTTHVADPYDISGATGGDLASALAGLTTNRFADVTVTGVAARIDADEQYRSYTLNQLLVRHGKTWVALGDNPTVKVRPGARLALRAVLTPFQGRGRVRVVDASVTVPKRYRGQVGQLQVAGGVSADVPDPSAAHSFAQVLGALRATPRLDALLGTLTFTTDTGATRVAARRQNVLDQVVSGTSSVTVVVAPR